jgi:hypothetical protein
MVSHKTVPANRNPPPERENLRGKGRISREKDKSPGKRETLHRKEKYVQKEKSPEKEKIPPKREDARRLASPGNNYEKVI